MSRRHWIALAVVAAATAGVLLGAAAGSGRVLHDPAGYRTRDPALPATTVPYVRRPLQPLPLATLETR